MDLRISFGQTFGCLKSPEEEVEFAAAFDRLNTVVFNRLFAGSYKFREWVTGTAKEVARDKKIITDFALGVIRHRRVHGYDKPQKDLLQLCMDIDGDDGKPLSDEMLKDLILNFIMYVHHGGVDRSDSLICPCITHKYFCACTNTVTELTSILFLFISAGRDTTAQALSWMFYLLHRSQTDPNVVKKLVKEVDDVLRGEEPTYDTCKTMKYAEAW